MKPKYLHAAIIVLSALSGSLSFAQNEPIVEEPLLDEDLEMLSEELQMVETLSLSDSGWSDPTVGKWNSETLTGTLTKNLKETIYIVSSGVTLDGAGHTVTNPTGGYMRGVLVWGRSGVTVKNLTVQGTYDMVGIYLLNSNNNTLSGNLFSNNLIGIHLVNSNNNILSDNIVSNNINGIFLNSYCSNNSLTGNMVSSNYYGIEIWGNCNNNTLTGNNIVSNSYGIQLGNANNNLIYNNNLIANRYQAFIYSYCSGNIFNLDRPNGGNYWSDWTSPDADNDYFVDNPYIIFTGGQDNLPWVVQDGWRKSDTEIRLELLIEQVLALNLPKGFVQKLNDAIKILTDANPNNDSAACNKLNDFIDQVNSNADEILDAGGDPAALIAEAEAIIAMLEAG